MSLLAANSKIMNREHKLKVIYLFSNTVGYVETYKMTCSLLYHLPFINELSALTVGTTQESLAVKTTSVPWKFIIHYC